MSGLSLSGVDSCRGIVVTISNYFYTYTLAEYTLGEGAFYFCSSASSGIIRVEWGMYQLGAVVRFFRGLCPELTWVQLQGAMGR